MLPQTTIRLVPARGRTGVKSTHRGDAQAGGANRKTDSAGEMYADLWAPGTQGTRVSAKTCPPTPPRPCLVRFRLSVAQDLRLRLVHLRHTEHGAKEIMTHASTRLDAAASAQQHDPGAANDFCQARQTLHTVGDGYAEIAHALVDQRDFVGAGQSCDAALALEGILSFDERRAMRHLQAVILLGAGQRAKAAAAFEELTPHPLDVARAYAEAAEKFTALGLTDAAAHASTEAAQRDPCLGVARRSSDAVASALQGAEVETLTQAYQLTTAQAEALVAVQQAFSADATSPTATDRADEA